MKKTMTIKLEFEKGMDVAEETKKFRNIFSKNNLDIIQETVSESGVSFTAACDSKTD